MALGCGPTFESPRVCPSGKNKKWPRLFSGRLKRKLNASPISETTRLRHERYGYGGSLEARPNHPATVESSSRAWSSSATRAASARNRTDPPQLWMIRGVVQFSPVQWHFNAMVSSPHRHHNIHSCGYLDWAAAGDLTTVESGSDAGRWAGTHRRSVATLAEPRCSNLSRAECCAKKPNAVERQGNLRAHVVRRFPRYRREVSPAAVVNLEI